MDLLHLPCSLVHLSLDVPFGLKELYLAHGTGKHVSPAAAPASSAGPSTPSGPHSGSGGSKSVRDAVGAWEGRMQRRMAALVSGLPHLEVLRATWDLLVQDQNWDHDDEVSMRARAALCAPKLRRLTLTGLGSVPDEALDALDARCPAWESLTLADGRRRVVRVGPGMRLDKREAHGW